ncbi:hypothetical protein QJS66_06795 [Kocuria rhizophila]|nr:hypothetical protein QJS66_06795 [Kocuria rhizophila]
MVTAAAAATGLTDRADPRGLRALRDRPGAALRDGRRLIRWCHGVRGPFRGMTRSSWPTRAPAGPAAPHLDTGPMVTTNSATGRQGPRGARGEPALPRPARADRRDGHPRSPRCTPWSSSADGSTLAQASPPDMRLPIALGIAWPHRVTGAAAGVRLDLRRQWTFEPLDSEAFPAGADQARRRPLGGTWPAVFNAANEQAVHASHRGELGSADRRAGLARGRRARRRARTRLEDVLRRSRGPGRARTNGSREVANPLASPNSHGGRRLPGAIEGEGARRGPGVRRDAMTPCGRAARAASSGGTGW